MIKLIKWLYNDSVFSDPEFNSWETGELFSMPKTGRNRSISDCFDVGKLPEYQEPYNHEEYIAWRKSMSITKKNDE